MKYFQTYNFTFPIVARPQITATIQGTYLGKKLSQEIVNFYAVYVNQINAIQFQAANNPNFQRLDFQLPNSLKKELNFYLRTQVKQKTFVQAHNASDKLFEAFTPIYSILQDNERLFTASLYWRRIFEFIDKWEKRNNYLMHKGTLFSFWSLAELLAGDSDVGFMLMRKGLIEDERYHTTVNVTSPLTSPALDFIRLDITNRNSYFRNVVKKMRKPIGRRINSYNATFNYNFTLGSLRSQFSRVSTLEEAALYFNVAHMRLTRIKQMFKINLGDSETARHTLLASLFDISRVAEVVARKSRIGQANPRSFTIRNFLNHLVTNNQWNANIRMLGDEVNNLFNGSIHDTESIMIQLLSRNMSVAVNQNFPPVIYDCLLLYGLRNYGAHAIHKIPDVFTRRYLEIIQMVYNGLFFLVENYTLI